MVFRLWYLLGGIKKSLIRLFLLKTLKGFIDMSNISSLFISLLLTTIISFATPALVIGTIFAALLIFGYVPGLTLLGHCGTVQILHFLAVFGTGNPLEGLMILGFAFAVVACLFDLFIFYFYRYQDLHS